ncbi:hypothetical protein F5B18DRAFT_643912 [Nemania serpens]|nr:hypothetical protein F5B18DRAFT_643912 [Nemania serpens]
MAARRALVLFPVPFQENVPTVDRTYQDFAELMPASSRSKKDFDLTGQQHRDMDVIERAEATIEFLGKELCISRLNDIHDHLWLAGRPVSPRPLNYQVASSLLKLGGW